MKKLLLLVLLMVGCIGAQADDLTGKAKTMRSEVMNYLRSEGYLPKIDSDGDIEFKKEGVKYWISLDNYNSGVYINTYSSMGTDNASMFRVRQAANTAQRKYKFVRCNVYESNVVIGVPVAVTTLYQYKEFLPDIFDIIKSAKSTMKEEYNEQ